VKCRFSALKCRKTEVNGKPHATLDLPEDIAKELRAEWKALPCRALGAIALEGYRSGELMEWQVQLLLGFGNRVDAHRFLQQHEA